jgi:nicotinate-nucleotide adenylyltransferase
MGRLIGVFGGTFDPPHLGHLILAEQALEALDLELVLWVLTPRSPLKPDGDPAPVEARGRLVEAAIADQPRFRLSRVDIDRTPPYYAVGTLEALRRLAPEESYVYLLGSDSLAALLEWHEPGRLLEMCAAIGVMLRPGHDPRLASLEERIPGIAKGAALRSPAPGDLRQRHCDRVGLGRSIRYLVPSSVEAHSGTGLTAGSRQHSSHQLQHHISRCLMRQANVEDRRLAGGLAAGSWELVAYFFEGVGGRGMAFSSCPTGTLLTVRHRVQRTS